MDAAQILARLLEAPETDPPPADPDDPATVLAHYDPYGSPAEFQEHVQNVFDHARHLKMQAVEAKVLSAGVIGRFSPAAIDQAFLCIACEDWFETEKPLKIIVQRLRRNMHSIW